MDKIALMEDALLGAGYMSWDIYCVSRRYVTDDIYRTIKIEYQHRWSPNLTNSQSFDTFDDMFSFVMSLKPVNEILYRKF